MSVFLRENLSRRISTVMMSKSVFMDNCNFANVAVSTESRIALFKRVNLLLYRIRKDHE